MASSTEAGSVENQRILKLSDLNIVWGDDQRYWLMPTANEEDEPAELLQVCWLEITGSAEIHPLKRYQIGFQVSLGPDASGWEDTPIYIMAKRGEKGQYAWQEVNLEGHNANEKFIIPDNFVLEKDPTVFFENKLYFGLYEIWKGEWKHGLKVHHAFVKELTSSTAEPISDPTPRLGQGLLIKPHVFRDSCSGLPFRWHIPTADQVDVPARLGKSSHAIGLRADLYKLVDMQRSSYQVEFQLSLASDAFGWDDAVAEIRVYKGYETFKRAVSLAGRKPNEKFIVPDEFIVPAGPVQYGGGVVEIVVHETTKNGLYVERAGLQVHHVFFRELISK